LAVAALSLLLAGNASAVSSGWITMSFDSANPGEGVSFVAPGKSASTIAGVYNQRVYLDSTKYGDYVDQEATKLIDSLGTVHGSGTERWAYAQTFCSDVLQYASYSALTYDIYKPEAAPVGGGNNPGGMGDAKAAALRKLWYNYGSYGLGTQYVLGTTTYGANQTSAAFQMSVWNIIYDTDFDVKTGSFRITSGNTSRDLANFWLGHLGTDDPDIGLRVLVNQNQQDFSIIVPGVGSEPIPEPVTLAGVMLGIGSLGGYIRRRRRRD
jgi:hypothetical protein